MYLVNDIQFSKFRLWVFLTCVLYRFQRASNRDWLCYFADTNSASSACRVVTDCMIGAKQITAVPFREVSACRCIASCTGMCLVNGMQFSRFRLWVFPTCILYRVQRASNRDWLCYFCCITGTNSASSVCWVVTDCTIRAFALAAVILKEMDSVF